MSSLARQQILAQLPRPDPSPELVARLGAIPADALADLVLDRSQPWWRRRPCALALRGRLPAGHLAPLLERVRDPDDASDVRCALLDVLSADAPASEAAALLAWLRDEDGREQKYGVAEAMLVARGRLRDLSVLPALAVLAADPWPHRSAVGEAAIDDLIAALGLDPVLGALGVASLTELAFAGDSVALRLLGVRLLDRTGGDITPALADHDTIVAHHAHASLTASAAPDDAVLWQLHAAGRDDAAASVGPTLESGPARASLWALCVLHRRGRDVRDAWRALGGPRVPLGGVPDDVRQAILREYAPGQRQTDPRWLLEAACLDLGAPPDEAQQLARAVAALSDAGLSPEPPRSVSEIYPQCDGTFHDITFTGGTASISRLGPFAAVGRDASSARDALAAAGFRLIDPVLFNTEFSGLHVYHFGRRDPLSVGELLFYWQD